MNCSSQLSPSGIVWRVLVACTADQGVRNTVSFFPDIANQWLPADKSVVSAKLSRIRRDSGEPRGGTVRKWQFALVAAGALLLSFTIMIALCVKKQ
jgi:hypothetical protein